MRDQTLTIKRKKKTFHLKLLELSENQSRCVAKMSLVQGSLKSVISAASGRGQGAINVSDTKNIDKESKFVENMYEKGDENIELRKSNAQKFVDSFYSIATDFYETGWGQSFHFAARARNETFRESIIRHEHYLALKLNIKPDDVVLDLGLSIYYK